MEAGLSVGRVASIGRPIARRAQARNGSGSSALKDDRMKRLACDATWILRALRQEPCKSQGSFYRKRIEIKWMSAYATVSKKDEVETLFVLEFCALQWDISASRHCDLVAASRSPSWAFPP
jgi:hypothetical protein